VIKRQRLLLNLFHCCLIHSQSSSLMRLLRSVDLPWDSITTHTWAEIKLSHQFLPNNCSVHLTAAFFLNDHELEGECVFVKGHGNIMSES
jgi:hypothetical protein